jgi:uncharacterized membrane protein
MLTVSDSITIDAPLELVFRTHWNPELWPRITPHVKRIEMLESGLRSQRFRMEVESNGRRYETESVRTAEPHSRIAYVQTRTPALFARHCGEWLFSVEGDQTRVALVHEVVLSERAPDILGSRPGPETESAVADALRRNGNMTMSALKRWIEALPNRGAA